MKRIVKKPDVRRKEIIDAATELFRTQRYDNTSMQALVTKLKIAKGTLYHYFSSKEELLEAVVEELIEQDLARKQALVETKEFLGLDPLAKFKALVSSGAIADGNEEILAGLHHPGNTVMHTRQLGRYLSILAPLYAKYIEEGVEQGVFKTAHPLECAEFMLAGVQFLTDQGFYPWTEEQLLRRVKAFPSLIETQLGAPQGSFSFIAERL